MITFSNSYFSDQNWIWIVFVYLQKQLYFLLGTVQT